MEKVVEKKVINGMLWKLLERLGVYGVQFVLQLILAAILTPSDYGCLGLMMVFVNLANVFVQKGFNTSLVQNKDVNEDDYSSVFWVSLIISVALYLAFYFGAPFIARAYKNEVLTMPFRVLGLILLPGALNSVQIAKATKTFDFKSLFTSNIGAIVISGIVGIAFAYLGFGLWALVAQSLSNVIISCIIMGIKGKWLPRLVINFNRVKVLFSFGWKLLVSGLIETGYTDLSSLVVGLKFSTSALGFYNRGQQFPQAVTNVVNGAVSSVMLPAISEKQDKAEQAKSLMRNSIILSGFLIFPMMAGMAAIAKPMVLLILKEKWVECVPYLQIFCISLAFGPVHSCNLQGINAMGRSDIFLKLEIIKKTYGLVVLLLAVFVFETPLAMAWSAVFTTFIACFVNASPNKKLIGYSYFEQIRDILPSIGLSLLMMVVIWPIQYLKIGYLLIVILQIVIGIIVYSLSAWLFKTEAFRMTMAIIDNYRKRG